MISIKTEEEIKTMKKGGKILAWVMKKIIQRAKPGVSTLELDKLAEKLIEKGGGRASFKMVPRYHWATCMCVNDCVVHGIPGKYQLKEGDILGIDIGVFYKGFHTDMARTLRVRSQNSKLKTQGDAIDKFLKTGKMALKEAVSQVKVGNRVGHISKVIQDTIENRGYSVVKTLVGHGVGRDLHEEPQIPCFLKGKIESTPLLKKGMMLAIEVIYNLGEGEVILKESDSWTILTKDGKLSGLFEDTVAITEKGRVVLTK